MDDTPCPHDASRRDEPPSPLPYYLSTGTVYSMITTMAGIEEHMDRTEPLVFFASMSDACDNCDQLDVGGRVQPSR